MAYITTQLCTMLSRPPLPYSPPFPIDLDSQMAIDIGVESFGLGSRYGLGTNNVERFVRRNYEPRLWRATGSASGVGIISGYSEVEGDPSAPIFDPPKEIPILFDNLVTDVSTTPYGMERPDFSRNERIICELSSKVVQPAISGVYPIGFDIGTGSRYAGYLFPFCQINIHLDPYSWSRDGEYYLEQECSVFVGMEAWRTSTYGASPFMSDEGVQFGGSAGMFSRLRVPFRQIRGTISVSDPIMTDSFGNILLLSDTSNPQQPLASANLDLICIQHYLPTPGY